MNNHIVFNVVRGGVLALGLLAGTTSFAWHGGGHGGHGGWHGGGWHGGGWHGGGWHGGGWNRGWGYVGVPHGRYYYGPACKTIRVCNRHGRCWLKNRCY